MGKLTLYGMDASPPVRACLLTLKALDLPFEYVRINLLEEEQLSPEFIAKNPQHTVPTLEDDGHYIWDSHAIMAYLVRKYGKNDALYPKDFLLRAIVDQRLHYECGVIFTGTLRYTTEPILFKNMNEVPKYKIDRIIEIYNMLEIFLKDRIFMADTQMTIADFSIISSISSLVAYVPIAASQYPRLAAWIKRMQQLPYYHEANGNGAQQFEDLIKEKNFIIASE